MATESAIRLIGASGSGSWPPSKDSAAYNSSAGDELGFLAKGNRMYGSWRESLPDRSGSAPPSMEGSLAALSNLLGQQNSSFAAGLENFGGETDSSNLEEQLRSDPAYLDYYFSKVNLNPRLPPPLISKESRRLMHRGGKAGNWRIASFDDSSKGSLFLPWSVLSTHKEEPEDDRSPRLDSAPEDSQLASGESTPNTENLGANLLDLLQNSSRGLSKSLELNARPADVDPWAARPVTSPQRTTPSINNVSVSSLPSSSGSDSNANVQPALQHRSNSDIKSGNGTSVSVLTVSQLEAANSGMEALGIDRNGQNNQHLKQKQQQQQGASVQGEAFLMLPQAKQPNAAFMDNFAQVKLPSGDVQSVFHSSGVMSPFYTPNSFGNPVYQNLQPSSLFTSQYVGGYALSPPYMPPVIPGYSPHVSIPTPDGPLNPNLSSRPSGFPSGGNFTAGAGADFMQPYKMYGQLGLPIQPPLPDPNHVHFYQHLLQPYGTPNQYNVMIPRASIGGNLADSFDPQKILSPGIYPSDPRFQFPRSGSASSPTARKGATVIQNYHGNSPYVGIPMPYPTGPPFQGQPLAGAYSPVRRNDSVRFPSSPRNTAVNSGMQGPRGREKFDEMKSVSFLEELRSNRTRRLELSDITGHIVEYSADQHGSRFIQQKLENCSAEEKASVFEEVLPHASSLMTDVFGNYVIQKFFEYGSPEQRRALANELVGHILPLSFQMYGCRVIQKALEVIEVDQKIQLVRELDGHVMRCVRDQNGNHVIQKCIECVPTEHISFIISAFRGQVAGLSTHPYGCRVIQRVLEHCSGDSQGQCIVDEILQSACTLAQDQYGNYVAQHVLERGNSYERSQIIGKLAGQIVIMSQNKFASNVIEKCFEHGDTAERELLIKEIVEQTQDNDNLLAMMKDQFANYVVQKILETCTEKQREILLNRIKGHLQCLRKYTYGKHIVSRVEQLCGEGTDGSES